MTLANLRTIIDISIKALNSGKNLNLRLYNQREDQDKVYFEIYYKRTGLYNISTITISFHKKYLDDFDFKVDMNDICKGVITRVGDEVKKIEKEK